MTIWRWKKGWRELGCYHLLTWRCGAQSARALAVTDDFGNLVIVCCVMNV